MLRTLLWFMLVWGGVAAFSLALLVAIAHRELLHGRRSGKAAGDGSQPAGTDSARPARRARSTGANREAGPL